MRAEILYVIGALDVGGAERHLVRIVPHIYGQRYRATIYTLTHAGALAPSLAARGVRIVTPPLGALRRSGTVGRALFWPVSFFRLVWLLIADRPAVVHTFLPHAFIFAGLARLFAFGPLLVMSRRGLNTYHARHPVAGVIERFLFRFARAGLGNSRAVVDQLRAEGFPTDRLGLIYNGIDAEAFPASAEARQQVRRQFGTDEAGFVIVVLANLIPYKGHADLLRALVSVRDDLPAGWWLWCIGRDDGIGGELARLADELGIADHIAWLGERDDVPALLSAADLYVHPSHEEGFSNAVLEAMAAGLASVVTAVGGNPEAMVDGTTGLVVPPRDPAALATGILRLCRNDAERAAFGRAARRRVKQSFSLDACTGAYLRLYDGLLAGASIPIAAILAGQG